MARNLTLFQPTTRELSFPELLDIVQPYMSEQYKELLDVDGDKNKNQLMAYIEQYISTNGYTVKGFTTEQLVGKLYDEMAGYSFLTPFLLGGNIDWEEININRWDDTKITFSDGTVRRSEEQFLTPKHAVNTITRLLRKSGAGLANDKPLVRGHLNKQIRVTVIGSGVIDPDAGISASIRNVNPKNLGKEDFIRNGMATERMLDFLSILYRYGISMCLAGDPGTGKTTLMGWILRSLPNESRVFTIENTTREFDLTLRDAWGYVLNNVVHTVTRVSDDPKQCVTEQMLLEQSLTFDPSHICLAEMKGAEAYQTQEAARTGPAVICTVHAKSCKKIYDRILDLCSLSSNLGSDILTSFITDAFPICFYLKKGKDGKRRLVEICECEFIDGKRILHTLYRWHTLKNVVTNGNIVVEGKFEQGESISESLQQQLRDNGIPEDLLQKIIKKE